MFLQIIDFSSLKHNFSLILKQNQNPRNHRRSHASYLERTGSSSMVSNNGFLDLDMDIRCLNSGVETSSIPSKLSLGTATASSVVSGRTLTFPAETRFTAELAFMNRAPRSLAVTTEFFLFIGNITYTFAFWRSSSALRMQSLRPIFRDLELTMKKFGVSIMSSAALVGWWICRISPDGKITFVDFEFLSNNGFDSLQETWFPMMKKEDRRIKNLKLCLQYYSPSRQRLNVILAERKSEIEMDEEEEENGEWWKMGELQRMF